MLSFLRRTLYIRIHPDVLSVRDVYAGKSISEPPLMAILGGVRVEESNSQQGRRYHGTNPKILAMGNDAKMMDVRQDLRIVNPFAHPRTPLSDVTVAEILIKGFMRKLSGHKLSIVAPTIVIHLAVELDGGITQIEASALRALGVSAGAKRCCGWLGPDLTDEQLMAWRFPDNGRVI